MEDYLIRTYIKRNLADLLIKTAKMYPDIFTPEIIAEEMSLLSSHVASMDITYNLATTKRPTTQPNTKIDTGVESQGRGTTIDTGVESQGRGTTTEPVPMVILPSPQLIDITPIFNPRSVNGTAKPRCIARIMDKEMPITQDSHGNKIYGKQCNYRESDPVTHKCGAHAKHSPHGDFTTEPSDVLKQHFQHVQSKVAKKAS